MQHIINKQSYKPNTQIKIQIEKLDKCILVQIFEDGGNTFGTTFEPTDTDNIHTLYDKIIEYLKTHPKAKYLYKYGADYEFGYLDNYYMFFPLYDLDIFDKIINKLQNELYILKKQYDDAILFSRSNAP